MLTPPPPSVSVELDDADDGTDAADDAVDDVSDVDDVSSGADDVSDAVDDAEPSAGRDDNRVEFAGDDGLTSSFPNNV